MSLNRIIVRTCEDCHGSGKLCTDPSSHRLAAALWALVAAIGGSSNVAAAGVVGSIAALYYVIRLIVANFQRCPVCDGRGKRRTSEVVYESDAEPS